VTKLVINFKLIKVFINKENTINLNIQSYNKVKNVYNTEQFLEEKAAYQIILKTND
jgi:hypothetical protein